MSGCVNIALRDILAGSVAGGYGGQPLKAGGAAQPGAALPALCLWSRGSGICPWKCLVSWMGEGFWWSCP